MEGWRRAKGRAREGTVTLEIGAVLNRDKERTGVWGQEDASSLPIVADTIFLEQSCSLLNLRATWG